MEHLQHHSHLIHHVPLDTTIATAPFPAAEIDNIPSAAIPLAPDPYANVTDPTAHLTALIDVPTGKLLGRVIVAAVVLFMSCKDSASDAQL